MLQVTAPNHPGPTMPNGASVTCGLMAYRPQPEFWDLAESRLGHFCPGRASPPSCPKPARPQASGLGFDPGRNARVESCAWSMGSSSFQPCPRPARPRQKCPGRAEICRGLILPDPEAFHLGLPWGFPSQIPMEFSSLVQVWFGAISNSHSPTDKSAARNSVPPRSPG